MNTPISSAWRLLALHLASATGAAVVLSPDKKDWPAGEPALVNVQGAKHIAITGRGTFDGNAQWEYRPVFREDPEIKREQDNAQRAGLEMKRYYHTGEVQKRLFLLRNMSDLTLQDFQGQAAPEAPAILKEDVTVRKESL